MTRRKHCRKDKNFLVNFRCREGGRFGMRSALFCASSAERIFIISQFWKICGFSRIAFSREGSWRETAFAAPLSAKARRCGLASSPSQSKPNGFARFPLLSLRATFPRWVKAYALPETFSLLLKLQQRALDLGSPFGGAGAGAPERACPPPKTENLHHCLL